MRTSGPEQAKFDFSGPLKKEREHKEDEYAPEASAVPEELLKMMERIREIRAKQGETLDRKTLSELARAELNWEISDKKKKKHPSLDPNPDDPLLK